MIEIHAPPISSMIFAFHVPTIYTIIFFFRELINVVMCMPSPTPERNDIYSNAPTRDDAKHTWTRISGYGVVRRSISHSPGWCLWYFLWPEERLKDIYGVPHFTRRIPQVGRQVGKAIYQGQVLICLILTCIDNVVQ